MPYANKDTRLSYHSQRRKNWRDAGLCTRCGGPREDNRLKCSDCSKQDNKDVQTCVSKHIQIGNCRCGKPPIPNKRVCTSCREYSKKILRDLKFQVLRGYGNRCACCGIDSWEFLSVDHVKERGTIERKRPGTTSGSFYRKIIKDGFPDSYQILCYNCNLSLGFFGYCPHHPEITRSIEKVF